MRDYPSGLDRRLPKSMRKYLLSGKGVFIPHSVDVSEYNKAYFSSSNIAYSDGSYSFDKRKEKFHDCINNIQTCLPEPILDIGCGPGFLVNECRSRGLDVQGIDIAIEQIKKLIPNVTMNYLQCTSVTNLPFAAKEFSSAYSFHTLEHLTIDEIKKAVKEISRVVQKRLYLIIPLWSEALLDSSLFYQIINDATHRTIATRAWWIDQFASRGWNENTALSNQFDRISRGWVFVFDAKHLSRVYS